MLTQTGILQLYKQLYLSRDFTPLVYYMGKTHKKQREALEYLTDDKIKEVFYGGSAGGAKTFTGCYWLLMNCISYPNTRWYVARQELKQIRQSVIITFYKLLKTLKLSKETFVFNRQDNILQFPNGATISLVDCHLEPSDPMFERLGSTEYTGGWIEEAGQVVFDAFEMLKSRTGRAYNDVYNLTPKTLITANPTKNWTHRRYWTPHKNNKLPDDRVFIQARVYDNPFIAKSYIENLEGIEDKIRRQRLLGGDWDFADSELVMMSSDAINNIFTNYPQANDQNKYIVVDVARKGKDKTIIYVFKGWEVIDVVEIPKATLDVQYTRLEQLREKYNVMQSKTLVDEDGVGGGLVDMGKYKGFIGGASPVKVTKEKKDTTQNRQGANYPNLKTQCVYYLAKQVNTGNISVSVELSEEHKQRIIEDLGSFKKDKIDQDDKLYIQPKDRQKEILGRSPDDGDVLLMRSFFDLTPKLDVVAC